MVAPALLITGGVTLASRAGVINPGHTVLPYPLFVLFGTLLWLVFAEAVEVPHQAFEGARSYLTRVNFSRESIILSQLYESLITTAVRLLLALLLLAIVSGVDLRSIALVSICFIGAVLLGLGIGSLLMPFTLLFADLHNTIKLILSYGLFLTPAMYQPQEDGLFATLVRINPVWPLMDSAREAGAGVALSHPQALAVVLCGGILTTILGLALVRAVSPIVVERMLLGGR
ncbi:MAG: hypothetical protein ABIQ03_04330 [Burkholderiales bacterium]